MGLSIHTNYTSLVTQNTLNSTNKMLGTAMERLGTGFRINSAADDAAGLQIATRLQAQTNGQGVAMRNAQDAISMMQTAEGAFDEMSNIVQRMKDLATQAANGTNSASELKALDSEYVELTKELGNILDNTSYGAGTNLLSAGGKFDGAVTFQIGASTNEKLDVNIGDALKAIKANQDTDGGTDFEKSADGIYDLNGLLQGDDGTGTNTITSLAGDGDGDTGGTVDGAAGTGITARTIALADVDVAASQTQARDEMERLDSILNNIGAARGQLGANINRLEHTITNLGNMRENGEQAKGRIMDADFAQEASNMSKNQMLMQSGMSVLSNSNQMSGLVMSLLR